MCLCWLGGHNASTNASGVILLIGYTYSGRYQPSLLASAVRHGPGVRSESRTGAWFVGLGHFQVWLKYYDFFRVKRRDNAGEGNQTMIKEPVERFGWTKSKRVLLGEAETTINKRLCGQALSSLASMTGHTWGQAIMYHVSFRCSSSASVIDVLCMTDIKPRNGNFLKIWLLGWRMKEKPKREKKKRERKRKESWKGRKRKKEEKKKERKESWKERKERKGTERTEGRKWNEEMWEENKEISDDTKIMNGRKYSWRETFSTSFRIANWSGFANWIWAWGVIISQPFSSVSEVFRHKWMWQI